MLHGSWLMFMAPVLAVHCGHRWSVQHQQPLVLANLAPAIHIHLLHHIVDRFQVGSPPQGGHDFYNVFGGDAVCTVLIKQSERALILGQLVGLSRLFLPFPLKVVQPEAMAAQSVLGA